MNIGASECEPFSSLKTCGVLFLKDMLNLMLNLCCIYGVNSATSDKKWTPIT